MFYLATSEDNNRMIGEDLVFCDQLTRKGLKVGLDANIWTGHFGMHEFRPDMWYGGWRDMYLKRKAEAEGGEHPPPQIEEIKTPPKEVEPIKADVR